MEHGKYHMQNCRKCTILTKNISSFKFDSCGQMFTCTHEDGEF